MRDRDGQHGHQKRQGPAVDPLRNPAPISPARDPEHPAITGPEELPAGVEPVGTNPEEVLCEQVGPGNPQGTRTPCPAPPPRRRDAGALSAVLALSAAVERAECRDAA